MSELEITREDAAHGTLSTLLTEQIYNFNQATTGFTDAQLGFEIWAVIDHHLTGHKFYIMSKLL